ncbi:MAG: LysR family transcriptional regulator [Proteobacteria bacterium]|nr:LysR family transcriptional regulator [Pseudomonadota bacterium]
METLVNLESFVRSAQARSFSGAARRLGLTPAAVSRNVATLERSIGQRLFQRSTRRLALTEAGERFLMDVEQHLDGVQAALAGMTLHQGEPAGVLKVSVAPSFGVDYVLPLLPSFLERYPAIRPDWQFDNRQVDLVAEGFDAAVGGGFELAPGVVARALAPAHIVAVASPAFMRGRKMPAEPSQLADFEGIAMRSTRTRRLRQWLMRDASGAQEPAQPREHVIVDDPAATSRAALLGLGVALVPLSSALPLLESGALLRLLPEWYGDLGAISIYYASRTLLPAKTRAFVDHVAQGFEDQRLAQRLHALSAPAGGRRR